MNTLKERLESRRLTLAEELDDDLAILARDLEEKGEDTTPSQHPADVASDLYAREELVVDELVIRKELTDIDDALGRIAEGTYGVCVDCAHAIDRERLEIVPDAQRCITCQRAAERARPRR